MTNNWDAMINKWHFLTAQLVIATATLAFGHIAIGGADSPQPIAFPEAVGQGAASVGGRGGDVYHVVNLSDYNEDKDEPIIPGSLRHAIRSAKGPRTIVFDIGGAIKLHGRLDVRRSNQTIAGQTAPGGITVWGYPLEVLGAKDVVIRYLRVRTGDFNARIPTGPNAIAGKTTGNGNSDLDAGTANGVDVGRSDRVIVDHISAAWGMDETLSVTLSRNVTVQNTIIAQSLDRSFHPKGAHGYGSLVRGELTPDDQEAGTGGYTFYRNLWAFHRARNPSIAGQQRLAPDQPESARRRADVNVVNNVIYGWGDQPTHRSEFGEVRINLIGNYYICGPMKKSDYIFNEAYPARTQLFHEGNMLDADQDGLHNGQPVGLAGDIKRTFRQFDEHDTVLGRTHGRPFNFFATVARKVVPAEDAYTRVMRGAGASLSRDAIDTRITEAVIHRTGTIIDSQEILRDPSGRLAGIDDLASSKRSADFDTDSDGMSDKFELEHGLDPHDPADRNGDKLSKEGYTNLEAYLNGLVSDEKLR